MHKDSTLGKDILIIALDLCSLGSLPILQGYSGNGILGKCAHKPANGVNTVGNLGAHRNTARQTAKQADTKHAGKKDPGAVPQTMFSAAGYLLYSVFPAGLVSDQCAPSSVISFYHQAQVSSMASFSRPSAAKE